MEGDEGLHLCAPALRWLEEIKYNETNVHVHMTDSVQTYLPEDGSYI